jgi:outer membrane protein assembly factor BamD
MLRRGSHRPLAVALACAALALALSGCRTNREDDDPARSAPEVVYQQARRSLDGQDFQNAIRIYEALVARYPFSMEARQSRLDLIYAYYKARESESAIDAADTFIRENPTHPRVDYAWYVKGLVDFERQPNSVERLLKVDLDKRPPQTASRAFASFRRVVEEFPKSEYAHDARRRMIHLRNRLADYQIYVARHYMERGAWIAAAQRGRETIEQYDGAPAVREALEIMIESYERLGMADLAEQTRQVYTFNYGDAPGKRYGAETEKRWWKPWS